MNKQLKGTLVPELRFPEFRGVGKWEEKQLKDICQMQAGKFVRATEIYEKREENSYPCYGGNGLRGFTKSFTHDGEYSLIGRQGALCGNITFTFGKFHATEHAIVTTPKEGVDNNWLFYKLKWLNLNQYATGQAQPGLSVENLEKLPIQISKNKRELQKIADCLCSADELITTETKKLDAMKSHKKGLLQHLFLADGETVPKLRFPEFRKTGEWTEYQLGQCLSRHPEYGINAPAVPYADDLPTYLRITDISENGQIRPDQKVSVAKGVTGENYLDEGDIVLARTGASVGKTYKYRTKDGRLVFAGFLIRIKPDEKKINSELLFQFFSTEQYWHWVNLTSTRSGQPGINGNEYSLLPISLPPTLKEQQHIADCLYSIDEAINVQTQKIHSLNVHKKGLMQQFFPVMNEVNG